MIFRYYKRNTAIMFASYWRISLKLFTAFGRTFFVNWHLNKLILIKFLRDNYQRFFYIELVSTAQNGFIHDIPYSICSYHGCASLYSPLATCCPGRLTNTQDIFSSPKWLQPNKTCFLSDLNIELLQNMKIIF